jgi:fatty acid desaturase
MLMRDALNQSYIRQADYVKKLRAFLPEEAFHANVNRVTILVINLVILLLGWEIASDLDRWAGSALWLYLPLTLIMANSVIVLLFSTHDIMHHTLIKNPHLLRLLTLIALTPLWMPPTLWRRVHNRVHHNYTNSDHDPDRNYLHEQRNTWGKWIQNLIVPAAGVNRGFMAIGMMFAWGVYTFRNLTAVLLFNSDKVAYVPAAFTVSSKERRAIAIEFLAMLILHLSVLRYLQFDPLKLLLSYFLPLGLGYAGILFYVYTNHMLCQMTEVNDPLINCVSIRVPKIFDLLHFNFSYHTEHHIFPGLNSDYYPLVQNLLKVHYPDRTTYLLSAQEAWRLMIATPRHYQDAITFTNWAGDHSAPCPLTAVKD